MTAVVLEAKPGGRRSQQVDGLWIHHFSQSWLNDLSKCPEMARTKKPYTYTDSTALGSAAHQGFEAVMKEGLSRSEGHDAVEYWLDHQCAKGGGWEQTKFAPKRVYQLAHQAFSLWHDEVWPHVEPQAIEWKFTRLLHEDEHRIINLTGAVDLADNDNVVWDWKTAGQPYEVWERQRYAFQPTAYTWAWNTRDDEGALDIGDERWMFRYAILLHSNEVQYVDVWRSIEHVQWLRQQAVAAATLIEATLPIWPLNDQGWHCSPKWCHKFDACKGAHAHDEWMTSYKEHGP